MGYSSTRKVRIICKKYTDYPRIKIIRITDFDPLGLDNPYNGVACGANNPYP